MACHHSQFACCLWLNRTPLGKKYNHKNRQNEDGSQPACSDKVDRPHCRQQGPLSLQQANSGVLKGTSGMIDVVVSASRYVFVCTCFH